jgi:protein dithiol oxidoreductase (disulfide-forming)
MMKTFTRREFVAAVGLAGVAAGAAAQGGSGDGFEYKSIKPPAPTDAPAGKVEVIEFFWFGCPHCHSLEPALKEWLKRLPSDVAFRKAHVPWQVQAHQQLFFTLETLNLTETLNDKVFAAIHVDRNKLDTPEAMADLVSKNGVDRKQFLDTFGSFGVRTRMQRATQLAAAYRIDGVPTFGVAGRWITAPSMAGSNAGALKTVDLLVERARKGA